ncbi:MAG: MaoC/PaaZ C-terminal domain-containing protein [Proteobacteria bacterium]|jgi:acyl dehydratase|nr:MaoC/PaaZ C-terminal domain-containing protein [Pseudomonadota bacterium]
MVDVANISVGDALPPFMRDGAIEHWNRFAAANYEFAAHHWDNDVAAEEGFPAPFAMAPLQHAFCYAMLREWLGEQGRIVEVNIRLRSPFLKGRTLTVTGQIVAIRSDEGETLIDLDITETDDQGTLIVTGSAIVAV